MKVRYCRKCPKCRRRAWKGERRTKRDRYVRVEYAFAWCVLHRKRCREVKNCSIALAYQVKMELGEEGRELCRDVRDCSAALAHQVKMELGEKYREQEREAALLNRREEPTP